MKLSKDLYLEAIVKIEKFSPAPRVLSKAVALLRNPDSDIGDIANLVKSDTALTADIIRGSNSAYYGVGERVSSLDRAVAKIGFRESLRLLNLAVAHLMAARDLGSYGFAAEDFWAESLFHGLFMERLARTTGAADPDEAHTAGLLRYIGRLAINQCIHDLGGGLFWDGSTLLEDWEMDNVGFPHTHAGARLLQAWQFTDNIVQAVEWQNEPARLTPPNWLADALEFAGTVLPAGLGVAFATQAPAEAEPAIQETEFMRRHGLTNEQVQSLIADTRTAFAQINSQLYSG
ncbi:MAG: HDOD domain-containing protein [Opitutae bacterium]|nr:HDOD domain-containing protein [Opitutae bacterium]